MELLDPSTFEFRPYYKALKYYEKWCNKDDNLECVSSEQVTMLKSCLRRQDSKRKKLNFKSPTREPPHCSGRISTVVVHCSSTIAVAFLSSSIGFVGLDSWTWFVRLGLGSFVGSWVSIEEILLERPRPLGYLSFSPFSGIWVFRFCSVKVVALLYVYGYLFAKMYPSSEFLFSAYRVKWSLAPHRGLLQFFNMNICVHTFATSCLCFVMETTPKDDVDEETVKTTSLGAAHQLLGQQECSGDDENEAHSTQG
ncbi:hypothetical protein Fmac_011298 [Flemingia macrophylla]|uniref:Uncharacterized protein n=1 Tax=Flemingia macrophylla TaxID=520843 RepID=A0ABD1MM20_9FABA